jgi:XTP/dITP diphosphohydrolase
MDGDRPTTNDQRATTVEEPGSKLQAPSSKLQVPGQEPGAGSREPQPRRLLLASRNPGKLAELRALLCDLPIEVAVPEEMPEVEETGATFAENAILKARALAAGSGEWALADDSGLEVDALGGRPGVFSSRYGGPGASDADRNARLLAEMADVPESSRTARFRCAIALVAPDGRVWTTEGACEGRIAFAPRGEHGFGYDPILLLPDRGCTMAELPPEEKSRISHRARALAALRELMANRGG